LSAWPKGIRRSDDSLIRRHDDRQRYRIVENVGNDNLMATVALTSPLAETAPTPCAI